MAAAVDSRPIRFRVNYQSPRRLLQAFTESVGRGSVELPSKRKLAPGTRFLFELSATNISAKLEVMGEVTKSQPGGSGGYLVCVRYDPSQDRKALDATLRAMFDEHSKDRVRAHPRVPFHIRAQENASAPEFRIRDLSRGGAGLELSKGPLASSIKTGAPVFLQLETTDGQLALHGQVAWTEDQQEKKKAAFGVRFGTLQKATMARLDRLLVLYALPTSPWTAKVSFGLEAVERMP